LIGEVLPRRTFRGDIGAHGVIHSEPRALRIAEIELGEIPTQVRLGNVLLDAIIAQKQISCVSVNSGLSAAAGGSRNLSDLPTL
jgi:hypothetical protein